MIKKKKRKKKLTKKAAAILKEKDREWRLLKTRIHTQLDNAFVEFMYVIENENIEIEKSTESHLINTLYEPKTVKMIEEEIKSDEKQIENLVSAARKLAKHLVKMKEIIQKKRVEVRDLEQAIQEVEIWPITILNQKA